FLEANGAPAMMRVLRDYGSAILDPDKPLYARPTSSIIRSRTGSRNARLFGCVSLAGWLAVCTTSCTRAVATEERGPAILPVFSHGADYTFERMPSGFSTCFGRPPLDQFRWSVDSRPAKTPKESLRGVGPSRRRSAGASNALPFCPARGLHRQRPLAP